MTTRDFGSTVANIVGGSAEVFASTVNGSLGP